MFTSSAEHHRIMTSGARQWECLAHKCKRIHNNPPCSRRALCPWLNAEIPEICFKMVASLPVVAILWIGIAGQSFAQEKYPNRPITIVAPFPPGGVADLTARPVAAAMEKVLKNPVVVSNKTGAAGAVGMAFVANSKPDGYNLLMALSSISIIPEADKLFDRKPAYTMDQLIPIALISADPTVLVVPADKPWKTAKDFIEKGTPGNVVGSEGLFQTASTPKDDLKEGAISDPDSLGGLVATTDIYPGQQLTVSDFGPTPADALTNEIAGEERAISMALDSAHGMIGNVRAGDRVDVYGAFNVRRLRPDGTVACWGRNQKGQLGDGTTVDRSAPVTVAGLGDVAALAAGRYHACAVLGDGTVRCWGNNFSGQLGDGTNASRSLPAATSATFCRLPFEYDLDFFTGSSSNRSSSSSRRRRSRSPRSRPSRSITSPPVSWGQRFTSPGT